MMSDVDHNSVYHRKMALLQEKLRKSEEERLKLEEKFSVMMKECKEEEEERLSHLKLQYENFLEEDRKRRDRNDRIMRSLDRIESRAATLNAKSKRLKLLREHYEAYLKRVYPTWKNKSQITSSRNNHVGHSPISSFDQHIESSYPERFTAPFTTNRRNSASFSDNLTSSPRLMDLSYSPRNYNDTLNPTGFARYNQHTLDREAIGGKSKFPTNVYGKSVVQNGMEYVHSPDSYIRGTKTNFNNVGMLNDSPNLVNGYSGFTGHSDIFFNNDTPKRPFAYENGVQNVRDGKTEIHGVEGGLQLLHENGIMGSMEKKWDLNPVHKKEIKYLAAGVSADIDWEQSTSRDLHNMSLSNDGKVSNAPCKTEQLLKHQQNLHVLKKQMEDMKLPMTEDSYDGNQNPNKDFSKENVQKQGKEEMSSDYNKQEETEVLSPHKTYVQGSSVETNKQGSINSEDNSTDDISVEIGKKIERALSSERETVRASGSPENQRNLDIIVEETNSTEENHSQTKSMPEKTDDFSMNDSELLSGAVLTEGDDELQYSLSNEAGINESIQQQIIPEGTAISIEAVQILPDLKTQNGDILREDYQTNFEGNDSQAVQGEYESNIQNEEGSFMYLQQPQNVYETAPTYTEGTRQIVYNDYNNESVNTQDAQQYSQEMPKEEVIAETYEAVNFDSGIQQMQTGSGDLNEPGIMFENTQDQNYIYDTVQNTQEDYNPGGEGSGNFYVDTYDSSDPNFGQQLQSNNVVTDQNWEQYNEMVFQDGSGQGAVQSTYQNLEMQQETDIQNPQPGEFMYSQDTTGNGAQFYSNDLEQQGPYNQELGQDQYFYDGDVQSNDVPIQEDLSVHQQEYRTSDSILGQQTYQQPEEEASGFSPQPVHEPNPVMDKTNDGTTIPPSHLLDVNRVSDTHLQQSSEQYTENVHTVGNVSHEESVKNSEMQRQMLGDQNAYNSESIPNTVQEPINLVDHVETENTSSRGELYQEPDDIKTELALNETTNSKTDRRLDIEQSTITTEVAEKMSSNNVQGDVRRLDVLDTKSEVKDETHINSINSFKDVPSSEQSKDIISGHQDVVESNTTTKSDEKLSNSGDKREQSKRATNKESSDLDSAKSVSGEEEFSESFDGGKYHEPTVGYESGIPGYSNAADSTTTEDSSERWTTMPKKTRQQMTLKVQNKKAETTLPPDEDSSDESVLQGPQVRDSPYADTSKDSQQLGKHKEPLNIGDNTTTQPEIKLSRLPARGSSKLPMISTVMDSDNDSLHLGSESSMT